MKDMIEITYRYFSASDAEIIKTMTCRTLAEADEICSKIEALSESGYKLIDVSHKFDGVTR